MIIQRRSKPAAIGVSVLVQHSRFTPTPNMTPMEIAFRKGQEARRLGDDKNPYESGPLADNWMNGYEGRQGTR